MPACSTARRHAGFSLVELLVGIAVLLCLLVVLQQFLAGSSAAWKLGEARKERMQNARAIAEFIAQDLESALLPLNRPNQGNLQFIVNPPGLSDEVRNRDTIFWQAPRATDTALGDVATLGYFVKWDFSRPRNPRALLCRFFANYAQRNGPAVEINPNFRIYSTPTNWINDDVIKTVAPANAGHSYEGLFAENVPGLWVRTLDSRGEPITASGEVFDSRAGYNDSALGALDGCALPSSVEVSVALLDARSAGRLTEAQQAAISSLARGSATAEEFVTRALADPALAGIRGGLRSHQTRVSLWNAP